MKYLGLIAFSLWLFLLFGCKESTSATEDEPMTADPAVSQPLGGGLTSSSELEDLLKPVMDDHGLIGMMGAILQGSTVKEIGAVGIRKFGSGERLTVNDKFHLGSCTKAMTATLAAISVEKGEVAWDTNLGQVFKGLESSMDSSFRAITLKNLLTHLSGLPANVDWWDLGSSAQTGQRRQLLKDLMGNTPLTEPGVSYLYSNVGYALAGHMLEEVTGVGWESLIQERLFQPLGMATAGFGPPGSVGLVDQPWGHHMDGLSVVASQSDNAPPLGPAGRAHMSFEDWSKFISLHLSGARGETGLLLSPATFTDLHTAPSGQFYALGWFRAETDWSSGLALNHAGSNTMWYVVVWLSIKRNFAVMVGTNLVNENSANALNKAVDLLVGRFNEIE